MGGVCAGSVVTRNTNSENKTNRLDEQTSFESRRFHYNVKMGDRSVYKEITSVVVPVRDIIVHPQLSVVGTIQKDLALLQLLYPVNFTMTIQPICIPQKTFRVEAGTTCWVTGWGRKEEYGSLGLGTEPDAMEFYSGWLSAQQAEPEGRCC